MKKYLVIISLILVLLSGCEKRKIVSQPTSNGELSVILYATKTPLEVSSGVSWLLQVELTNLTEKNIELVYAFATDFSFEVEKEINGEKVWVFPGSTPTVENEEREFEPTLCIKSNSSTVITFRTFPIIPSSEAKVRLRYAYTPWPSREYKYEEDERYFKAFYSKPIDVIVEGVWSE